MYRRSKPHLHPRHSLSSSSSIVTLLLLFIIITIIHRPSTVTALSLRKTIDWAIHGIGAEVFHNTVVRPLSSVFGSNQYHNPPIHSSSPTEKERSIAIVTGATGGIGTELCHSLLSRNYHVLVLARNVSRGKQLVQTLGPHASFVEYHADRLFENDNDEDDGSGGVGGGWIGAEKVMGTKPIAVLINNAGVMGGTKRETMEVNLVAPTVLTLSLLESLKRSAHLNREKGGGSSSSGKKEIGEGNNNHEERAYNTNGPIVVNVGSSSHLRTTNVDPHNFHSDDTDSNLASYAESKLGLMQFSNVLRQSFPWLTVVDAHPGLVRTPLLQDNFPGARFFDWIGLSKVLFKSPKSGAETILAAVDEGKRLGLLNEEQKKQVYVVNRKVGGYSSKESRDVEGSISLWNNVLGPVVRGLVPGGYEQVQKNLVSGGDNGSSGTSTCSSADSADIN